MRVDLPAPFSPTTARTSPGSTCRLTWESACTPGKDLETPDADSRGGMTTSLAQQLVHFLAEGVHVVRGDDAVRHEDGIVLLDPLPVLEDVVLPLDEVGKDLDRLVTELVGVLHDRADDVAALDAVQGEVVLVEGDD